MLSGGGEVVTAVQSVSHNPVQLIMDNLRAIVDNGHQNPAGKALITAQINLTNTDIAKYCQHPFGFKLTNNFGYRIRINLQ